MVFDDAVKLGFSNYVNFSGRACRSEYWYWVLFTIIGVIASRIIDGVIGGPRGWIYAIFSLATLIPSWTVLVRRLHDVDRSGWWALLGLLCAIPLLGWLIFLFAIPLTGRLIPPVGWWTIALLQLVGAIILLIWLCTKGTDGPNRFGPDRLAELGQISPRPA